MYGYTGQLLANSQGGGCGECARLHRYTMGEQSGSEWPGQGGEAASVYGFTGTLWVSRQGASGQAREETRRVCAGTPVHYG